MRFSLLLIGLMLIAVPRYTAAQPAGSADIRDDFSAYPNGSDASPAWQQSKGFWYVSDGQLCEVSGTYDAGAFVPRFLDTPYEATVRFRVEGDYRGAGFLFNSASPASADYAHMVRLDDEQVIIGYFEGGAYYPQGDARLPDAVKDDGWHTLTLNVDPGEGRFGVALDGQTLREGLPLRFRTGYLGLQNSGGPACFDDVAVQVRSGEPPVAPWPMAVLPGPGGVWVASPVAGTVQRLAPDGRVLARLNAERGSRPFAGPAALAPSPGGGLVVLDAAAQRLHRFDAQGSWQATGGPQLQEPSDVAAWPDGTLAVSDPGAGTVVFYDAALTHLGRLDGYDDVEPGNVAAAPGLLAFADRDAGTVHLLRGSGTDWQPAASFALPPGAARGLALAGDALFVAHNDGILRYDLEGRQTAALPLDVLGGAYPQRLAVDGADLYVADYFGDRVIVTDTALTSPRLTHTFEGDELRLQWQSGSAAPGRVEVRVDEELWAEDAGDAATTAHAFTFDGVQPATLYRVRYGPLLRAIPQRDDLAGEAVLMSPPPEGKTAYVNLESAVILFANVVDEEKAGEWPEPPPLPQAELDRIVDQIQDGRRFFWMNSGMRLNLDMDFFVVDRPLTRGEVFEDNAYYAPRQDRTAGALAEHGADLDDYESIYYVAVVRDYDPATQTWDVRGPGGAFTQGFGWNGRYGRSWWEATRADHPAGNNWLVVHEFHHQLDEFFMLSGYPEYWFNHFSPHIGTSADFGEHFDGNAYLAREWPADRWFDLDFGALALADDADMDGIPDDAPSLPMDEARLGSSPDRVDTDGDGLTDLEEVALSNWIVHAWGQTYAEPAHLPDPADPDTDGDGQPDGSDPYPLTAVTPLVSPAASGFGLVGATADPRAPHRVEAAWSPDSLLLRVEVPEGRPVRLLLDANADGWFAGRDNVEFRLTTGDTVTADVNVFHAGRPDRWATMDRDLAESVDYTWRRLDDGTYQLAVARMPRLGLELASGETIGLNLGVALPGFGKGRERYLTIHEPNRFLDVVLTGDPAASGTRP